MKKKQGAFFGFAVLLIAAMFTVAGCDNGNDPGSNSGPDTTIINLPQIALAGTALELGGVVESSVVNDQTIIWSGDYVVNGTFTATSAGSYEITATVPNGLSKGSDYVKTFTITVYDSTKNQIAELQGAWTKPNTVPQWSGTDTITITGSEFVLENDSIGIGNVVYAKGIILKATGTEYKAQVNATLGNSGLRPSFFYDEGTYTYTVSTPKTITVTSNPSYSGYGVSPALGTWTEKQ